MNPPPPNPATDAQYLVNAKYKSGTKGFSIADSNLSGVGIHNAGAGFDVNGGSIAGSFAGGTGNTHADADGKSITAFVSSSFYTHLTSANAKTGGKPCQASAKNKKGVWSLKAPKGIAKIGIASGTVDFSR